MRSMNSEAKYKISIENRLTKVETLLDEIVKNHLPHIETKIDRIMWLMVVTFLGVVVDLGLRLI